ncbi:hypothetical protein C0992_005144 [Termitomyces sp. T32_za158]|nr:hypothetical protein C0992_005144 [Termitomyces sp. T32_za158]
MFGPLKDAKTGMPLFNHRCWEIAKNALENIRRGYYSDPPGVTLYYAGKRDKFGLLRYRCCRGTNAIEGGVHQNMIRWFGAFNATPEFALELLRDYVLYHNLKLLDVVSTRFSSKPPDFYPGGWVNGDNFVRSTEVFGILPLPLDLRNKLGMLVYHPDFAHEVKIRHQYLALRQDTRVAILPVHTQDERGLFKLFVAEANGLFSGRSEPNWYQVAEQWNNHANGLTVFYKLPEQLKAYWRKWQENTNEKNSVSINQAAFNNIMRALSLSSVAIMPVITAQSQSVRQQVNLAVESPSAPVENWQISNALGRHSLQQSTIQFHYGEQPPAASRVDKDKKRALPEPVDEDDHRPVVVSKRKPRTCPRCHRVDCQGAYRSRPCN